MARPILTVIAGCNGAGKSSFSKAFTPSNTTSFDYDKIYLSFYNSLVDPELKDRICHNKAGQRLEHEVTKALNQERNFTYETNFNSTPLFWPKKFKEKGFKLRLFYLCLNSIDEAKRRVQIRVENGGHHVPSWEIETRYIDGFKHLNAHWHFFDEVFLFDSSTYKKTPSYILSILDHNIEIEKTPPEYLKKLLPSILK